MLDSHYPVKNSINNFSKEVIKWDSSENISKQEIIFAMNELFKKDYSENTKVALVADIKNFIVWYEEKNWENINLRRIVEKDIIDFKNDVQKKWKTVATINRNLVSVRLFLNEAIELGYLVKNPCNKVRQFKSVGLSPKSLEDKEIRKFLKEVELRWNLRDKTIIYLMLYSGLRVSEVVKLEIWDISIFERSWFVNIRSSKWGKTRKVPLSLSLREILGQYIKEYYENTGNLKSSYSWKIFYGQRWILTEIGVNKMIEKYSLYSQVKVTPHLLRHTFSYNYLEVNKSDIVWLSQILWHSSIETTAIYTQNRLEDLQERVEMVC
ncbi:MAG: phage integrase family protein [uncultured bacterium (gcode 4)]|uniref:Phage integrase family protein n=1 Tax=uncultured bacterium (gcode 4) TaxID=1234023 RepID=K2AX85_9BACT|nr:MAG: phage integrase family protein [uncultured bacterium (gcode 4)]